jgi:dTDP-4-amino-4,6-dideoxygalactose transaminase
MSSVKPSHQRTRFIPLLDLQRQYSGIRDEILEAIERVCSTQKFVLGGEVEDLEKEIAAFVGVEVAVGCASGTDALWLALAAAGIKPGDNVITTPFSFFASASSIVRTGAKPVFVDISPETLNIDGARVRQLVEQAVRATVPGKQARSAGWRDENGENTGTNTAIRAILPVHLYGQCADMDQFEEIAKEFRLIVIEDAAQAIGAKWRRRPAGSFGTAAAFSFYPTKNLSAYGEAGMVTTRDRTLAERIRRLRNHGSPERYLHTELGWNARMDAIQAAVLRVKLKYIDRWNDERKERAETYDRLLAEAGLSELAGSRPGHKGGGAGLTSGEPPSMSLPLKPLARREEASHVFHQYVIRAQRRDQLQKFLATRGIASEIYYPIPLHLQPVFSYLGYREGDLPESERAAREVLALPMFPELTEDEQKFVVAGIAEFYS